MRKLLALRVQRYSKSGRGATMFEYAILVGVIALVAIGGAAAFGTSLSTMFQNFGTTATTINQTATTN